MAYIAFNTEKAPFDNAKVRQALNYAVDKKAIIEAVYQGAGTAAKNPLPPTIWSYNDEIQDYPYDPEKAKQLLAEAGIQTVLKRTSGFNQWCVRLTQIQNVWLNL